VVPFFKHRKSPSGADEIKIDHPLVTTVLSTHLLLTYHTRTKTPFQATEDRDDTTRPNIRSYVPLSPTLQRGFGSALDPTEWGGHVHISRV
jgi:hypothetical protein